MGKSLFSRCMIVVLTLVLAFGQGAFVPAMANAFASTSEAAMQGMSGMDMSGTHGAHKDCCPSPEKHQHSKGNICASACAAMTQAALPSYHPVFMRQVVPLFFGQTADQIVVGWLLPPDHPPPRA